MGYECGRVWGTLEALQKSSVGNGAAAAVSPAHSHQLFSCKRPITFWDPLHTTPECDRLDAWGRCSDFAGGSSKPMYMYSASKERYNKNRASSAANQNSAVELWKDFCRVQWPTAVGEPSEWQQNSMELDEQQLLLNDLSQQQQQAAPFPSRPAATKVSKHLFVDRQLKTALAATAVAV
ncbi:MAG: hypothetical protein SGILL_006401 [Bacillariaceae sp.]